MSDLSDHDSSDDELEELYELLYLLPVGIVSFDSTGMIGRATPLSVQLMSPLVPMSDIGNAFTLFAPLVPDLAEMISSDEGGTSVLAGHRSTLDANGSTVTLELSIHRPRPDYYVAVLSDATEVVQREHELQQERDRVRLIVDVVREYAIYTTDADGFIDSWNPSGERLFGINEDQAIGQRLDQIITVRGFPAVLEAAISAGWNSIEGWSLRSPGPVMYTDTMISTLLDTQGRPEGFIIVTRDSTEDHQDKENLRREADTDPLTQLTNRRGFDAGAEQEVVACEVNGRPATVMMIDIDHFKSVNDTHGHDGGDIVLRSVAASLAEHVRTADVLARFGGEEFAVLMPGADLADATARAETLRAAVADLAVEVASGTVVQVTVSIGVAAYDGSIEEALQRADAALYRAKQSGRNRVVSDGDQS